MRRVGTARLPVAAVAASAGGLIAAITGVFGAALLVAPWAVLLILGTTRAQRPVVQVVVDTPHDRVVAGDDVPVSATFTPGVGRLEVELVPTPGFWSDADPPDRSLTTRAEMLSPTRPTVVEWTVPAAEWGRHDLGQVRIEITEPYGLLRWQGAAVDPTPLRVHPTPRDLRELLPPRLVRRVAGTHGSRAVDRGVEYADIRQYGPGDALRDINWRASARTGDLWVSQRHADRSTDVVVLLDSFVEPGRRTRAALALGIEAALAVTDGHLGRVDRVGLIDLGGIVRWVSPRAGALQLQRLTDALLATMPFENAAPKDLRAIPVRGLPPRSFVVGISPLVDPRFVDALHELAGRGHDVAVVETPPDGADSPVASTPEARVARRLWEADRQITRDTLAGHGVAVARWRTDEPLDIAFGELARARARAPRMGHR